MNQPIVSLIAALSENRVIGNKGEIPWKIPGEQKYFKEITTPHPIIMGRKTFQSIGRLLPNRPSIIITSDNSLKVEGAYVVHSLDEALDKAKELDQEEIFVIGGGKVFQEAIHIADRLYLTLIHREYEGDAFFPEYSAYKKVIHHDDRKFEELSYTFLTLEK